MCFCRLTPRPLFLDVSLQNPVERFARHLAGKHEEDLNLAVGPYQRRIDDAQSLGHESKPCAEVGDAVCGILGALAELLLSAQ